MELTSKEINQSIRHEIGTHGLGVILRGLVYGTNSVPIAAKDLLTHVGNASSDSEVEQFCLEITRLACDFPIFHPRLVSLITSITLTLPEQGDASRTKFLGKMAGVTGDLSRSQYAEMFDAQPNTSSAAEYINLHGFLASILSDTAGRVLPQEQIIGLSDALFIISTSLEDHSDSHNHPAIDVPAAAQYVIHSGPILYGSSKKNIGQKEAERSPLWATRGKLWTGESGLSVDRWDIWKRKFDSLAKEGALGDTAATALAARRAMDFAEKTSA